MKKIMAVLLSFVLVFSLAACSGSSKVTVESLAKAGTTAVNDADSVDVTMSMSMDMAVGYGGYTMGAGMTMDLNVQAHVPSQSTYMSGSMDITLLGLTESLDIESYTVQEDDHFVTYSQTSSDGVSDGWYREETEAEDVVSETTDIYQYMIDNTDEFTLADETEDVDGQSCYVVTGSLSGEVLEELLGTMDMSELLEDAGLSASDLTVNMTCYFTEDDQLPYRAVMDYDMTIEYDDEADAMTMTISGLSVSIQYNSFNTVDEITVPDDVIAAVSGSTDSEDLTAEIEDELEDELYEDEDYEDWDWDDDVQVSYGSDLVSTEGLTGYTLDGVQYDLGGTVQDYVDQGWTLAFDEETMEAGSYGFTWADKDDETIYLGIYNPTDEECLENECTVYALSVYKEDGVTAVLDAGIGWDSSLDDAAALIGEYTELYAYSDGSEYYYWSTEEYDFELLLVFVNGDLTEIDVTDYGMID